MEGRNSIIAMLFFGGNRGTKVQGANVYLESGANHQPVAFQQTGESGKITFAHLDKGVYRILLDIPPQKGKLAAMEPWQGEIKVGYHSEKKMYLVQEDTGFFSVRYKNLNNLANKNVTPMYEVVTSLRESRVVIGKFEVDQKFGSISLTLAAHSQNKFHKLTEKYKNEAGMSVIRKST